MKFRAGLILVSLLAAHGVSAHELFESGARSVPTLELFSSEGCSSCPPADQWFRSLRSAPGLWKEFVPLVFHVDYWDQLGWKDDLASSEYTERQRAYASEWGTDQVYTPEVTLAGTEWTGWRTSKFPASQRGQPVGNLKLEQLEKGKFAVSFSPTDPALKDVKIFFALLGMGVRHDVAAGENRGATLNHDFVVLQMQSQVAKRDKGMFSTTIDLKNKNWGADQLAAVAWISANARVRPLQAVGGFLTP